MEYVLCEQIQGRFSPPYGDGMNDIMDDQKVEWFSPPYGDGILNISQNIAKLKSQRLEKYSLYCDESNLG